MDMIRVELGGEVRDVPADKWREAADELHAKHGGGVPKITAVDGNPVTPVPVTIVDVAAKDAGAFGAALVGRDVTAAEVSAAINADPSVPLAAEIVSRREAKKGLRIGTPAPLEVKGGQRDIIGEARSTIDAEAAEAAGFAVAPPLYDRGTRVIEMGVENATKARAEWQAMPTVLENCANLIGQIHREDRQDDVALVRDLYMADDGVIVAKHVDAGPGERAGYVLTEDAFASLVVRMGIPGGGRYLRACWTELRSKNLNAWIAKEITTEERASAAARAADRASEYAPLDLRFRHRKLSRPRPDSEELREAFGVVGPSYADLDADKIAEAIARAVPPEARGRVTYDGKRTRFEILFHTTVQPKHFVAGEFFRAGVVVDTDDTGGGAINGHAVVHMNACLNLIIIHTSKTAHFAIRHVGDVEALAKKFREGFGKAMGSIDHFVKAWDRAAEEDVYVRAQRGAERELPTLREFMPWLFLGMIERDLIPIPARSAAKRIEIAHDLAGSWEKDTSGAAGPTRAAIANAITRWAHERANVDPWQEDDLQNAAGRIIATTTALPWRNPEDVE